MKSEKPVEVVIFIGIPASGKTTFYRKMDWIANAAAKGLSALPIHHTLH